MQLLKVGEQNLQCAYNPSEALWHSNLCDHLKISSDPCADQRCYRNAYSQPVGSVKLNIG